MISLLNNLGKLLKVSNNRISSIKKKTKQKTQKYLLWFLKMIFSLAPLSSALDKLHCSQGQAMVSSTSLRYKLLTFHKRQWYLLLVNNQSPTERNYSSHLEFNISLILYKEFAEIFILWTLILLDLIVLDAGMESWLINIGRSVRVTLNCISRCGWVKTSNAPWTAGV